MDERGYGGGGAGDVPPPERAARVVEQIRTETRHTAASQARMLRRVGQLCAEVEADARDALARGQRVTGQPPDEQVIHSAVVDEVMVVLGTGKHHASWLIELAGRLTTVLPNTLAALEAGRIDLPRARALAEGTAVLTDPDARAVEAVLLAQAGNGPWDGPSPRSWRARVDREAVRVDLDAARRRREAAHADRSVRAWPIGDGAAELLVRAAHEDIAMVDRVLSDLAHATPTHDQAGNRLSMDQRRADVFVGVFRAIDTGSALPDGRPASGSGAGQRGREIGLVLHTDTLFGDGPAADDPGELRGLGAPAPIDPHTAAESARTQIRDGAGTCVLLTDDAGALQRLVRLGKAPEHGWTRHSLAVAVRQALPDLPPLATDSYQPTVAITEHVRARNPHCTSYDCPRVARRCDLDHDMPWPRGPTDVANLGPRCGRHHETKTRQLVATKLSPDGMLTTTMLTGLIVTTRAEPLPGHGPGEGYGVRHV